MRLNKFISESGLCSRREADRYIEQGTVFINGKRARIGDSVFPGSTVIVNGHVLSAGNKKPLVLIALNKPPGITSTTELNVHGNIIDYVNYSERIFPIGRLDKDSQGLIFLTNEGDLVNKILRAGNQHEKEYVVTVNKLITESFLQSMANGVPMDGGTTKKCAVKQESVFVFRIVLVQGLNRQIRRMCEHFGYAVTKLERVRIMNIRLKDLPVGDWRELTEEEIAGINRMVEASSSEAKKKPDREGHRNNAAGPAPAKARSNPDKRNRFKKHSGAKRNPNTPAGKKRSGSGRRNRSR